MQVKELNSINFDILYSPANKKVTTNVSHNNNSKRVAYKIFYKALKPAKNLVVKARLRPLMERFAQTRAELFGGSKYAYKYVDGKLVNDVKKSKLNNAFRVRTCSRSSTILPSFEKSTIFVHNGKKYIPLLIEEYHAGYKLGEFIFTRKFYKHKKEGRNVMYVKKKKHNRKSFKIDLNPKKNKLFAKEKYVI